MFHLDDGTWITWDDKKNTTSLKLSGTSHLLIDNDADDKKYSGKITETI